MFIFAISVHYPLHKCIKSLHCMYNICHVFVSARLTLLQQKLERESVLSVRGQEGCGDGGHQAGDRCWFVPGEMTSQRLSALLFCWNSEDPIENALLCLFSF